MKRKLMIFAVGLALLAGIGCSDKYHHAIQAAKDLADAVQVAQQAAHTAHAQGLTTNDEDLAIQSAIAVVAKDGAALTQSIVNFKGAKGAQANLDAVLADTDVLLNSGVAGIKNPQAQNEIRASVLGIRALVDIIAAAVAQ